MLRWRLLLVYRNLFESGKRCCYTGNLRALFEQQNQKQCYEFLKKKIVCSEPLSVELAKEIHLILSAGTYDERRYIEKEERPASLRSMTMSQASMKLAPRPARWKPI